MNFHSEKKLSSTVFERCFSLGQEESEVRGYVWSKSFSDARSVVFMGHGGGGSARDCSPISRTLTSLLVEKHGFAVVCIDGPVHGFRQRGESDGGVSVISDFRHYWREGDGGRARMISDWGRTIEAFFNEPYINAEKAGYYGFSMGAAYGIPLCASGTPLKVAVLGGWSSDYPVSEILLDFVSEIKPMPLFVQKWDDEIMSREGQLRIFDRVPCSAKQMNIYGGKHADNIPGMERDCSDFFVHHLIS